MKLAVTVCATKSYTYAMTAQARRLQAALRFAEVQEPVIIVAGDTSDPLSRCIDHYKEIIPGATVVGLQTKALQDGLENYQEAAQLLIAQLRTQAFTHARTLDVDVCLSMDSDVLPPSNAVRSMIDVLGLFGGYYSVACCPYPSQGGGPFLCGRGTLQRQILPDVYEDERVMPEEVVAEMKALREFIFLPRKLNEVPPELAAEIDAKAKRLQQLEKELDKYPAKASVWELQARQYRRRGWFDNAYPGVGLGAVVPSDWCGFGCTMMNREALGLCEWTGYLGGTEDLFVCWHRWHPRGLKIAAIPHCLCDHVIRDRKNPGKYITCQAYHETEGECVGHIRWRPRPFYSNDVGERYVEEKPKGPEPKPAPP